MTRQGLMTSTFVGTFAAVLLAVGGASAADQPGQKFQISPASLAKPYATKGVGNAPDEISRPPNAQPQVPKGFAVSIFAEGLSNARWMTVAPNGDVFLAEPSSNKVTLLRDSKGAGRADQRFTFIGGLARPHGLALHNGYLYVGDTMGIWRVPYKDGQTRADVRAEKVTSKVSNLAPSNGHWTRNIAFGPDGGLYLALGSKENVSDFKPGAQVFKINADGSMSEFASGIRNPVGIAFQPGTNNLFVVTNERDMLGDALPPDYMTSVRPGGFYGYPYAYIGKNPDPTWGARDPGGKIASTITPDVLFQAHSAPLGLAFYTGSSFPAEYRGNAFVALHGSWNAGNPTGYTVVRVRFENGKPVNAYENFATGFWNGMDRPGEPARVWGRPAGLAVAKDGSLLIADDAANVVWRVAYTGK